MATKRSIRKRVAKALKKFVRGNPAYVVKLGPQHYEIRERGSNSFLDSDDSRAGAMRKARKYSKRGNPSRVKGRKVKGGRAVTVRNFTGTIVKRSDGTVDILGRGRK